MSAPPIGMIMSTPSTSAMMVISQKSSALPDITRPTMKNTSASASPMLMKWRPGRMIGAPLMRADSFRNAIRRGMAGGGGAPPDRHADHAKKIPRGRRGGAGQPAEGKDKQSPRHEIQNCSQIGVHLRSPLSSSPRGARRSLHLLLVHRQH